MGRKRKKTKKKGPTLYDGKRLDLDSTQQDILKQYMERELSRVFQYKKRGEVVSRMRLWYDKPIDEGGTLILSFTKYQQTTTEALTEALNNKPS